MWRADVRNGTFRGGCLAIWDLRRLYPPQGRGRDCTSADAAGLPIVPLLFSADEIAAGQIRHALRFVLPNGLIRRNAYVAPASHNTPATRGSDAAPPYGARMRLKASANLEALKPAARVVARALQTYGMFLADGGRITFNAVADSRSVHQWNDVDFGAHDLKTLNWADFEMVDSGPVIRYRDQCSREPVAQ
jgi:serine/threonine-protein kinase